LYPAGDCNHYNVEAEVVIRDKRLEISKKYPPQLEW